MVVRYTQDRDAGRARRCAAVLGLPCVGPDDATDAEVALTWDTGTLSLRDLRGRRLRPIRPDFSGRESASRKQLLGRAIGRRTRTVVDATAGWGEDARRLCAMGYGVTAIERHPVMAALLANAADRARRSGVGQVPEVVEADAVRWLAERPGGSDCVYLDPMFPPKRRASTLARRPLRLLRELVGEDPDRDALFAAARTAATRRVVVKRSDDARPLFGRPSETFSGKLIRYDVYHLA